MFSVFLTTTVPFRSIRQSRVTGPSVLSKIGPCHASPRPVSNRSNMWQGRKGLKFQNSAQILAVSAGICVFCLSQPLAAPIHHKMHQKLPVQALLSVENFTWSQSLAVCVESVELIQRVTVTGECRIDRNGTVFPSHNRVKYCSRSESPSEAHDKGLLLVLDQWYLNGLGF